MMYRNLLFSSHLQNEASSTGKTVNAVDLKYVCCEQEGCSSSLCNIDPAMIRGWNERVGHWQLAEQLPVLQLNAPNVRIFCLAPNSNSLLLLQRTLDQLVLACIDNPGIIGSSHWELIQINICNAGNVSVCLKVCSQYTKRHQMDSAPSVNACLPVHLQRYTN
jgi:hypothetical protein